MQPGRIKWSGTIVISRLAISPFAFLPLAMLVFASAVRGAEPLNQPAANQIPAGEAPLPDGGAVSIASSLPDASAVLDASEVPDASAAPAAKSGPHGRLVVGDAYTLEVKRGSVVRSFGGNLLKASDKWIVLRRIASGRNDYGVPLLSSLPKVGNYFRRSYESLVEDDVWIPREAATIVSHNHVTTSAPTSTLGDQPTARTRCGVVFAHGDKFERRDGELTAITDDKLTVLTLGPFRAPYPQQIARSEILCISIPVVLKNVRMTERDSSKDAMRK